MDIKLIESNVIPFSNNKTMSSLEIAELVESRHDNVKKSIETLVEKGIISQPLAKDGIKSANGVVVKEYLLNKRDSYVVVAQLSPEFTGRLVDRWQELESQQTPKTFSEALRLAADLQEQLEKANAQIEYDKPRVDFANAVRQMDGACSVGEFAKAIGTGQNRLFKAMREDKFLMINNQPYQNYIERGFFKVIELIPYTDINGKSHPAFKTMITGKGQVYLENKYRNKDFE